MDQEEWMWPELVRIRLKAQCSDIATDDGKDEQPGSLVRSRVCQIYLMNVSNLQDPNGEALTVVLKTGY